jgi:NitT/TauT family transport system substrate-binding protein
MENRKSAGKRALPALLALLAAVVLAAGGCSGQKKAGSPETPLKIALSPWPGWFFWFVVEEKGFFGEHGANVELVWFPVYSDSLQAFATGQVDANSQTLSDTLAPASKGIGVKAVLVNDNSYGGDAIVAKPEIGGIPDLKGKTVATELGTVDHFLLLTALAEHGMTEQDINFVNMTVNDAGPAFISGKTDAAVLWEPFRTMAVKEGGGKVLFSSRDTPGLIPDLLVFREEAAADRPDDVQKVVDAWFAAVDWYLESEQNRQEAIDIMARKAEQTPEDFRTAFDSIKLFTLEDNLKAYEPGDTYESLQFTGRKTAGFLQGLDMLGGIPDIAAMLEPKFVRNLAER